MALAVPALFRHAMPSWTGRRLLATVAPPAVATADHDRRIAVELAAGQTSREWSGTFQIIASAAPVVIRSTNLKRLSRGVARFAENGPSSGESPARPHAAETAFSSACSRWADSAARPIIERLQRLSRHPDASTRTSRGTGADPGDLQQSVAGWLDASRAVALAVVPKGQTSRGLQRGARGGRSMKTTVFSDRTRSPWRAISACSAAPPRFCLALLDGSAFGRADCHATLLTRAGTGDDLPGSPRPGQSGRRPAR